MGNWLSLTAAVYGISACGDTACRIAGSANSLTALMTVAEAEEVEEAESEAGAAAAGGPASAEDRAPETWTKQAHLRHAESVTPRMSRELSGECVEPTRRSHNESLLQSLQLTAER